MDFKEFLSFKKYLFQVSNHVAEAATPGQGGPAGPQAANQPGQFKENLSTNVGRVLLRIPYNAEICYINLIQVQ